jgi:hypothetical protein
VYCFFRKSGFWREIVMGFSLLSISAKPYGYTRITYVKGNFSPLVMVCGPGFNPAPLDV